MDATSARRTKSGYNNDFFNRMSTWFRETPLITRTFIVFCIVCLFLNLILSNLLVLAFGIPPLFDANGKVTIKFSPVGVIEIYRLLFSIIAPAHGFVATFVCLYLLNEPLREMEGVLLPKPANLIKLLITAAVCINLSALILKLIWFYYLFPKAVLNLGTDYDGGVGCLTLFCMNFLVQVSEENIAEVDYNDVPFFPFSVKLKYKAYIYALLLLIIEAGNVDLFCALLVSHVFAQMYVSHKAEQQKTLKQLQLQATEKRLGGASSLKVEESGNNSGGNI